MRLLVVALVNLLRALALLLAVPFRLLARRRTPEFVRFRLEGSPTYRKARRRGLRWFRRKPEPDTVASIQELRERLDLLARDPRVKGALFELEGLAVPPAKRLAIAKELTAFRAKGKQAIGYTVGASNGEYALLCAMDRILLPKAGRVELTGFAAEATAAGGAFKRFGIGAEFVRRGEHKTAPELFTHEVITPAVRETLQRFLDERHNELVGVIAHGRKLPTQEVARLIDEGPYSARRLVEAKLADGLCSEAQLPEVLTGTPPPPAGAKPPSVPSWKVAGFDSYAGTQLRPAKGWLPLRRGPRVSLVKLEGTIVHGEGSGGLGMKLAGDKPVVKALRAAARQAGTESVVLYIDSPGGSAVASELILEEVKRLRRKKHVLAYFDRVAASGGYMAAVGAEEIWAGPLSIAGSIGVFAGKFELSALLDRLGVRREVLTAGRNAGLQSTARGFTDSERASLEAEVEETYQAFLEIVAEGRKLTREEVHLKGEGRVYSGAAAVEAHLADRVGMFEDACRRALELSGKQADTFELVGHASTPRGRPLWSAFQQLAEARIYALWWPWLSLDAPARPLTWDGDALC